MKRIYTLLMALVIGLIPAMAEETTVCLNGLYYLLNSETHTAKVYYDDTTYGQTDRKYPNLKDLVIPSKVTSDGQEYVVTEIADYAFYYNKLWSVSLPETLTTIGNNAFTWCQNLKSVSLPEAVTTIGKGAFASCGSLTSVTLPTTLTEIGDYAFSYCTCLPSITLPETLTAIGSYAFEGCKGLTEINLPDGINRIGNGAFSHCI